MHDIIPRAAAQSVCCGRSAGTAPQAAMRQVQQGHIPYTKECKTGTAAVPDSATNPSLHIAPQAQRRERTSRPGHAPGLPAGRSRRWRPSSHTCRCPCTLTARRSAPRSAADNEGIDARHSPKQVWTRKGKHTHTCNRKYQISSERVRRKPSKHIIIKKKQLPMLDWLGLRSQPPHGGRPAMHGVGRRHRRARQSKERES